MSGSSGAEGTESELSRVGSSTSSLVAMATRPVFQHDLIETDAVSPLPIGHVRATRHGQSPAEPGRGRRTTSDLVDLDGSAADVHGVEARRESRVADDVATHAEREVVAGLESDLGDVGLEQ